MHARARLCKTGISFVSNFICFSYVIYRKPYVFFGNPYVIFDDSHVFFKNPYVIFDDSQVFSEIHMFFLEIHMFFLQSICFFQKSRCLFLEIHMLFSTIRMFVFGNPYVVLNNWYVFFQFAVIAHGWAGRTSLTSLSHAPPPCHKCNHCAWWWGEDLFIAPHHIITIMRSLYS